MSLETITNQLGQLIQRMDQFLEQSTSDNRQPQLDLDQYLAFRWHNHYQHLIPVIHPDLTDISDLIGIDAQIKRLDQNTRQFLQDLPANHVLLWGDRGTGKSSLVKGMLVS